MRAFSRNRRKLIKPHYVRGLKKTMTGTSKVTLENAIDAHIPYLEITGKTAQNGTPSPEAPVSIENANDNGMSVVLHGTNLATAYQIFADRNQYTELEFDGSECIRYQCDKATDKVIEGGFKENTQYTLSCEAYATVRTSLGNDRAYLYVIYYTDGTYDAVYLNTVNTWEYSKFTTKANKTVATISMRAWAYMKDIYVDVNTFQINEGTQVLPYEPYFRETVEIPTSIDVNGTSVSLLFSEYDKLAVDKKAGKVKYIEGGYYKTLTGNEGMGYSSSRGYAWVIVPHRLTGNGYSSHHQGTSVMFLNGLSFGDSGIAFSKPVFLSTDGLGTYLREQNANGTPVTVLAELEKPMEYDITKTEIGQALLSLATRQGTNYLEIVGDLEPSALNVTYYSESEQDQVNLTIKYMCGDREIKEPRVQEIRKGSKYLIVSPHIDGYTRISSEVYGVADENVEIELIYEENSDATI